MKKTLLTFLTGVLATGFASAQCDFDLQYANESGNFFPDSATFIDNENAFAGQAFETVISLKTIADTLVENPITSGQYIEAIIDGFRIYSIVWTEADPGGFYFTGGGDTYETADPRPDFNQTQTDSTFWNVYGVAQDPNTVSPVTGCVQITADAAAVSNAAPTNGDAYTDYPVTIYVDARIVKTDPDVSFLLSNGSWLSESGGLVDPLPVEGYILRVYAASGVTEMLNVNTFDVAQSYPNPANEMATISFTTPKSSDVQLNVYNMLGGLVYSQGIKSQKGVNKVELETASMPAGMYVYTVSNGEKTITKRMTVK